MLKRELAEFKVREEYLLSLLEPSEVRRLQESVLLQGLPQLPENQPLDKKSRLETEDSPRSGFDQSHVNRIERRLQSVLKNAAAPTSVSGSHHREVSFAHQVSLDLPRSYRVTRNNTSKTLSQNRSQQNRNSTREEQSVVQDSAQETHPARLQRHHLKQRINMRDKRYTSDNARLYLNMSLHNH